MPEPQIYAIIESDISLRKEREVVFDAFKSTLELRDKFKFKEIANVKTAVQFSTIYTDDDVEFNAYVIFAPKFAFIIPEDWAPSNKIIVAQWLRSDGDFHIHTESYVIKAESGTCHGLIAAINQCYKDYFKTYPGLG